MKPLDKLVVVFDALADATRLRLLNLMRDGEVCVCFFVEILGEGQSKISRHLAYLRRAGIVEARREGKWMHYGIARQKDAAIGRLLDEALAVLSAEPQLIKDRSRLVKVCCSSALPVQLMGAPIPIVTRKKPRRASV